MDLKWTKKNEWGPVGNTYRTEVTIGGVDYNFCVDQPRKGLWVARGWRGGPSFMYREARTLKEAKNEVVTRIIELDSAPKGADQ